MMFKNYNFIAYLLNKHHMEELKLGKINMTPIVEVVRKKSIN